MEDESIEEGVGESSSPPRGTALGDIKGEIYNRLVEINHVEAVSNPDFKEQLDAHFNRLPMSYLVDVTVDRAEDVLLHRKILAEAKDPTKRPVFHVRFMKFEEASSDVGTNADDTEDGRNVDEVVSARHDVTCSPIHEIIFSTVDKPKLLSQLSALLSDIGLNIREAHVFSTTDGFSLDVFVVDGWQEEETVGLLKAIGAAFTRSEGSWSGSTHTSAAEKILAVQPKVGDCEIDIRLLKIGEKVASGSSGDMHRGSYLGQDVAIKVLKSEQLTELSGDEFAQEVTILREVKHRNVVRFIGACTKPPDFCIVTEYMPGGSLYSFLHKQDNILQLSLLLKFALDVCKGMVYLHQNNIIHRDLKTANLLLDSNNVVKVADFGVARFQNRGGVMTAETGTYRWMAPEVINHEPYDHKADVFSFAIVLWELVTLKLPYESMTPLQAALGVRQGNRPELPENTHPGLLDLMQRCWDTDPVVRPSFSEIEVELEELLKLVQASGETSEQGRVTADEPDM